MRTLLRVLGVLCLLAGIIWILQGVGILPGSFMSGQSKWAIYGCVVAVIGVALLAAANRLSSGPPV